MISPYYDPMITSLIVAGCRDPRRPALQRMDAALAACQIAGVTTNTGFLRRLINTASFAQAGWTPH